MAAPTFLGYATVHGIDGTFANGLWTAGTDDNLQESLSGEDTVEEHEAKDKSGATVGLKLWNRRLNVTIDFYPSKIAAVGAIAAAKKLVDLPAIGSVVALAGHHAPDGTPNFAFNNTKWIYAGGGRIAATADGDVKITLPLRRYATDISTAAT